MIDIDLTAEDFDKELEKVKILNKMKKEAREAERFLRYYGCIDSATCEKKGVDRCMNCMRCSLFDGFDGGVR